jgi:hypothetical protein
MLHTEMNPCFQGSSAAAAMFAREFAAPEVCLCHRGAWLTAETEQFGQHLFIAAAQCKAAAVPIHQEATA